MHVEQQDEQDDDLEEKHNEENVEGAPAPGPAVTGASAQPPTPAPRNAFATSRSGRT